LGEIFFTTVGVIIEGVVYYYGGCKTVDIGVLFVCCGVALYCYYG